MTSSASTWCAPSFVTMVTGSTSSSLLMFPRRRSLSASSSRAPRSPDGSGLAAASSGMVSWIVSAVPGATASPSAGEANESQESGLVKMLSRSLVSSPSAISGPSWGTPSSSSHSSLYVAGCPFPSRETTSYPENWPAPFSSDEASGSFASMYPVIRFSNATYWPFNAASRLSSFSEDCGTASGMLETVASACAVADGPCSSSIRRAYVLPSTWEMNSSICSVRPSPWSSTATSTSVRHARLSASGMVSSFPTSSGGAGLSMAWAASRSVSSPFRPCPNQSG